MTRCIAGFLLGVLVACAAPSSAGYGYGLLSPVKTIAKRLGSIERHLGTIAERCE